MTKGAEHFLGAHHAVGTGQRAGADQPVGRGHADSAHQARPVCRPRSRRAGDRTTDRRIRRRAVDRSADQRSAGYSCPGDRLPGDAHRDVGARRRCRQHRHAAPPRRAHRRARRGPSGRRRRRARAGWHRPSASSPRSSGCSVVAHSPVCTSWSPPVALASRSTPCGSSPTAAAASRATPSPPRHWHWVREVTLVSHGRACPRRPVPTLRPVETAARDAGSGARRSHRRPTSS